MPPYYLFFDLDDTLYRPSTWGPMLVPEDALQVNLLQFKETLAEFGYELKIGIMTAQGGPLIGAPMDNFTAAVDYFTGIELDPRADYGIYQLPSDAPQLKGNYYPAWSFRLNPAYSANLAENFNILTYNKNCNTNQIPHQHSWHQHIKPNAVLPIYVIGHHYCKSDVLRWFTREYEISKDRVHLLDDNLDVVQAVASAGFGVSRITATNNVLNAITTLNLQIKNLSDASKTYDKTLQRVRGLSSAVDSYALTLQMVVRLLITNFNEASHLKARESCVVLRAKEIFADLMATASFEDVIIRVAEDLLASPSRIIQHLVKRRLFERCKTFYLSFYLIFLTGLLGKNDKSLLHNYVVRRYGAYPKGWTDELR